MCTFCVKVELLVEHVKQLALSHSDTSVRERAPQCLECAALCHPLVVRESILPSMLQLFTLDTRMCTLLLLTDQVVHVHMYLPLTWYI